MTPAGPPDDAILRLGPEIPVSPVLISVPHAGRDYPLALRACATMPVDRLAMLEDRYADLLISDAVDRGISALVATRARCWIDLNRDEREIDPDMIDACPADHDFLATAKVRGGLGLIPRRIPGIRDILRTRISMADVATRIATDHRPWHNAIAEGLAARRAQFGAAILLDCHTMPPLRRFGSLPAPTIVIGDRYGHSAADRLVERLVAIAGATGLTVARNAPYAGGHTLDRHGQPARAVHAIQVEIDRSLYLSADMRSPGRGIARINALIARMAEGVAEELGESGLLAAAE